MDDRAAVVEATIRMAWLADLRDWDALGDVLADEVRLDYTSLHGGEPATLPRDEVLAQWRAGLSGLDATQHLLGNHLVDVDGDRAVATTQFQATHVLANPHGAPIWTLGGRYRHELARGREGWRITAVTMTATWGAGNQRVMDLAAARPARIALAFLDRLSTMDVDGALALFADDAVQEMPYSPAGFPDRLEGIEALRRQYGGLPQAYRSMRFHVDRVRPLADPEQVLLQYRGAIELAGGGRYDNRYLGLFQVVGGRIRHVTEYFDPLVLRTAFDGESMGETFTLDRRQPEQ